MTPDQIMAVKATADILKQLGAMPLSALLSMMVFAPWGVLFLVSWNQSRRFEAVVKMYEANIELVKNYKELVNGYRSIVDNQQELIIHATQTLTQVKDITMNNLFCPLVRKDKKVEAHI